MKPENHTDLEVDGPYLTLLVLTHNKVLVNFCTSLLVFFGPAEGKKVAYCIFQTMVKDELQITKFCTMLRDDPNYNKKLLES